jgi:hypothetical protein
MRGQGHAYRDRKSVPERTGVGLDAGELVAIGMAVEHRERIHIGFELLKREEAPRCQSGVEGAGAVAFGEDKAVALRPLRLSRIEVKNAAQVEDGKNVGRRKIASGMTELCMMRHGHGAEANPVGLAVQPISPFAGE